MANISSDQRDPSTFIIVIRTCFILLLRLLIISGNILCIVVTRRVSNLAESTKVLMTTMAVSDLLMGCCIVVLVVPSAMDAWPYGEAMCDMHVGVTNVVYVMSVLSILFVNVERYIAVTRPYKFPIWCTRRRVIAVVISAFFLTLFYALCLHIAGLRSKYISTTSVCQYETMLGIFPLLLLIFVDITPMTIMTFVYYRMIKISREHERRINQRGQNEANNVQDNKALKTFLVVTLTFFICHTPFNLSQTFEAYTGTVSPDWLHFITIWFLPGSSALNVFIYCLFNRTYRQIAKRIILERLPCCKDAAVGPVNV